MIPSTLVLPAWVIFDPDVKISRGKTRNLESWNFVESHGITRNPMESWNSMESHGIQWNPGIQWNHTESNGIARNPGIQWILMESLESYGIIWNPTEFSGAL
jgi:hypothetical protein